VENTTTVMKEEKEINKWGDKVFHGLENST
jgi:hypothetical protein